MAEQNLKLEMNRVRHISTKAILMGNSIIEKCIIGKMRTVKDRGYLRRASQ